MAAEVAHRVGEQLAVVALVEVVAGLVALGDVERELPVVLANRQLGGAVAAQPAGRGGQTFEAAHARVAAFVQAREAGSLEQQFGDGALPALDAGGEKLRAQGVRIAVDDETRQAIGLAVDQA